MRKIAFTLAATAALLMGAASSQAATNIWGIQQVYTDINVSFSASNSINYTYDAGTHLGTLTATSNLGTQKLSPNSGTWSTIMGFPLFNMTVVYDTVAAKVVSGSLLLKSTIPTTNTYASSSQPLDIQFLADGRIGVEFLQNTGTLGSPANTIVIQLTATGTTPSTAGTSSFVTSSGQADVFAVPTPDAAALGSVGLSSLGALGLLRKRKAAAL